MKNEELRAGNRTRSASLYRLTAFAKKKEERRMVGEALTRPNKLHNRKNLRANPLVLFRLFLLSPKSLLRNTFRGPRHRFALIISRSSR